MTVEIVLLSSVLVVLLSTLPYKNLTVEAFYGMKISLFLNSPNLFSECKDRIRTLDELAKASKPR